MHYLDKRAWLLRHGLGIFPSHSTHSIYRMRWMSHVKTSWVKDGDSLEDVHHKLYTTIKDALFEEINRP